jgi:hypothetical protein
VKPNHKPKAKKEINKFTKRDNKILMMIKKAKLLNQVKNLEQHQILVQWLQNPFIMFKDNKMTNGQH